MRLSLWFFVLVLSLSRRILNYQLIMRMVRRIALVTCFVTAASVLSGCGSEEEPKKNAAVKTKMGTGARKPVVRPAVIQNDGADGAGQNNPPPAPAAPPPAPPAPPKKLSHVEEIQGIRNECLKNFESLEDIKDVKVESVYEKDIDIALKFHSCISEMGKFVLDENSASFFSTASRTLVNQMSEKVHLLHLPHVGSVSTKYLDVLITAGRKVGRELFGNPVISPAIRKTILAEGETRRILLKIFAIRHVVGSKGEPVFEALTHLKDALRGDLVAHFDQMKTLTEVHRRFGKILSHGTNHLLMRQRKSVLSSTAQFVRQTLSEIQKPGLSGPKDEAEIGKFFVEITEYDFIDYFRQSFVEPERTDFGLVTHKDIEIENVVTAFHKKLFNAFIKSSDSSQEETEDILDKVVQEGIKELEGMKEGAVAEKRKLLENVKAQFHFAKYQLIS